jgi:hypothetical protein
MRKQIGRLQFTKENYSIMQDVCYNRIWK